MHFVSVQFGFLINSFQKRYFRNFCLFSLTSEACWKNCINLLKREFSIIINCFVALLLFLSFSFSNSFPEMQKCSCTSIFMNIANGMFLQQNSFNSMHSGISVHKFFDFYTYCVVSISNATWRRYFWKYIYFVLIIYS